MKNRLFVSLAALLVLLAMTVPAWADPIADPNIKILLGGSATGTSFTGAVTTTSLVFSSSGNDNFFQNDTGLSITDFTIVFNNPSTSASANAYGCAPPVGGDTPAFSNCYDSNSGSPNTQPDFTWYFISTTGSPSIAPGAIFDINLNGDFQFAGTAASFTLTPSFADDHDGSSVPEPASLLLLGSGLAGLAGMVRRRRARS